MAPKNGELRWKRVLLKLSGEVFGGEGAGIDWQRVRRIGEEITQVAKSGAELAIVVGGGNIWRGRTAARQGMERATADYAGMVATVINALCTWADSYRNARGGRSVHQTQGYQTHGDEASRDFCCWQW